MVGQEHWHFGNPPAPPAEHQASLPVDVVVPVQVQDPTGHLTRHPLQGQQVRGHGLGPPAAPQVPLQVTLWAVPLSPSVPSTPGTQRGEGTGTHQRAELHHQQVRGDLGALGQALQQVGVLEGSVWGTATGGFVHHSPACAGTGLGGLVAAPWEPLPFQCQGDGTRPQEPSSCLRRGSHRERVPARPSAQDVSQRDICSAVLGQEQPRGPPAWPSSAHDLTAAPCHGQWLLTALVLLQCRDRTVLPQSKGHSVDLPPCLSIPTPSSVQ